MSPRVDHTEAAADPVASGWAALGRGDWAKARGWFEQAAAEEGGAEAFDGLSWAAWWQDDADTMFDARERAYRLYRAAGRTRDAARMAVWLGGDAVDFRGEVALAEGWFRRARRLLADVGPCAEQGWLAVHEAEKLMLGRDPARVRALGAEAAELGRRLGNVDLEMMGLATEGIGMVQEGAVDDGLARLSEAATAALGEEFDELWSAGWCCCYVIHGCEQVRDYDRAAQWCREFEAWTARMRIQFLNRVCRAHYAGILVQRGRWAEAEDLLTEAAERLGELRPPMAVEATVRLGELRRRQGRLEQAGQILDQVAGHPLALLGAGRMHLDQGDPAGCRDRAEEYLRATPGQSVTERAAGLELLARADALLGDVARAQAALDELAAAAEQVSTDPVRAAARLAAGHVAAARGDRDQARVAFEDAIRLFDRSGSPFESASARLSLAEQLTALGRLREARRQALAAAAAFRRIGAEREVARADEFLAAAGRVRRPGDAAGLTRRERQVLSLVASGRTNRAIAAELVLSEHTVNRHVTNILTKLGVTTRSAAVAEALRRELI